MSTVAASVTSLTCSCGYTADRDEPRPFRCPAAGKDGADHVLRRTIDFEADPSMAAAFLDRDPDPFVRFRRLTHAWQTATAEGMSDAEFVKLVRDLEQRIEKVDGRRFVVTPLYQHYSLTNAICLHGDLWVKNETGNVSGSHKARHLMGLALWLAVAEKLDRKIAKQRLAIASCGNAAIAAAVIARATNRQLDVFIPSDANETIVRQLQDLGANVTRCPRQEGVAGDPAYLRFREAVAAGALPFTCQGNENALAIEGGQTVGWEIVTQLTMNRSDIDRLFVQVGGGALASSCIAAFEEAKALGIIEKMPKVHAVQAQSAHPLQRAWDRIVERGGIAELPYAIEHRSQFMWPWEEAPRSIAAGILDDETYDWVAVVRGMLMTGGSPILVSERRLLEANELARAATGINVCPTGTAGLAGLIEMQKRGEIAKNESLAVIFTGRERGA